MSEFDRLQAQKVAILASKNSVIFDAVLETLKVGAPGLADAARRAIAHSIVVKLSSISSRKDFGNEQG